VADYPVPRRLVRFLMVRSVFEIVKAPLGWSVFADNVKIAGVYDSRGAALEAAALAASFAVSDGVAVQINVPGEDEDRPRWKVAYEIAATILPDQEPATAASTSRDTAGKSPV
jgi:hypothetical protein